MKIENQAKELVKELEKDNQDIEGILTTFIYEIYTNKDKVIEFYKDEGLIKSIIKGSTNPKLLKHTFKIVKVLLMYKDVAFDRFLLDNTYEISWVEEDTSSEYYNKVKSVRYLASDLYFIRKEFFRYILNRQKEWKANPTQYLNDTYINGGNLIRHKEYEETESIVYFD